MKIMHENLYSTYTEYKNGNIIDMEDNRLSLIYDNLV